MILTLRFTTAGYSTSALKIHPVSLLLHKTYHNGTIKIIPLKLPHPSQRRP